MMRRSKVLLLSTAAILVVAVAVFLFKRRSNGAAEYATAEIDRGTISEIVGATGALQAVTTVQVGSQVSGIIKSLYADFNSVVAEGQVVARLDPSLFEARLGQANANLLSAHANVERARAQVEDARQKFERARELLAQNLLPVSDHETAKANFDAAAAQVKAAEAAVSQSAANVHQAEVDLDHTVIRAPIAGVVVNRNVDVGQTVAASFQAPTIFVIANDLAKMQVNASIDEADIGRIETGQVVSFRVDAYPERTFDAVVEQIRLQPTTVQNVVTYNTIIAVDNPQQLLKPGMTATVSVITRKAENALRVPASALRFRPEGFESDTEKKGRGGVSPDGSSMAAASNTTESGSQRPVGSPGVTAGEGRDGRAEGRGREGGRPDGEGGRRAGAGEREGKSVSATPGEREIRRGKSALVFVLDDKGKPQPVRIKTGLSDGQFTEVREGLSEGARVVTGQDGDRSQAGGRPGQAAGNPFQPQFQRRQR
jgi:HlyD family secretion protein